MAASASSLLRIARNGVDVRAVQTQTRKPFVFYLCGDPGLIAEFRSLLLRGHAAGEIPLDAAATLETLLPGSGPPSRDAKCVLFLGRPADAEGAHLAALTALRLPILAITVDEQAAPSGPTAVPRPCESAHYIVPALSREALRGRLFPHLIECAKGVEIAVGRRLPVLRETVAAKLTRDAAKNALKVAAASAVVDHIPVLGLVLGAVASAGDMLAITGIQMMLLLHIEAVYGEDPDMQRMWRLLPVVGGGFGWRMLARELSGFIPIAGVVIKASIAYAGTVVVGEGVTFYHEHGRHMDKAEAKQIFDETKNDALKIARELLERFKNR